MSFVRSTMLKRTATTALLALGLALAIPAMAQDAITYGQTIEGETTTRAPEAEYTFTGAAGDSIIAQLKSDDFDSFLRLAFDGEEIVTNDDGGEGFNSLIGPFTLPESGEYTLIGSALDRTSGGEYEISVALVNLTPLTFGETATVNVTEDDEVLFFSFEGIVGNVISIEVDSDDVDTDAVLNDPTGFYVTEDSDSGSGNNPELTNIALTANGTYTLILNVEEAAAGALEVTIEAAELATLNDGPLTVEFSSDATQQTASFEAVEGTTYRLTFALSDGDVGSPTLDLTQDGASLGYSSATSVSRFSIDITPSASGTVVLRMSDYTFSNLSYQVTLEEVAE